MFKEAPVPVKKKFGRPRAITPELQIEILNHVASGGNLVAACELAGVSYTAFCSLRDLELDFAEALARARRNGAEARIREADRVLNQALTNERREYSAAAHNLAHHHRWVASHLHPRDYGDRVNVAGVPDAPLTIVISKDDDDL